MLQENKSVFSNEFYTAFASTATVIGLPLIYKFGDYDLLDSTFSSIYGLVSGDVVVP